VLESRRFVCHVEIQQFTVPAGAKTVTFGISDACNYNGGPSCYTDNEGAYTLKAVIKKTPCE
jgi:hypothetical protein